MYSLTINQKLENYQEVLLQKKEKIERLQREVESIERKIQKLSAKKL